MCGIAGYFFDSSSWLASKCSFEHLGILQNMADQMKNRGPDDSGTWYDKDPGIGFSHSRLAIIDLSETGHQPMHSYSGRYVITFNGEIYNFKEIQSSLDSEEIYWRGGSDTEVLLNAIEVWGLKHTLNKINGMFAFALFDKKEQMLFLVRDPMGKKPLYYGYNNNIFFFASELKALKIHPGFRANIDHNILPLFLRHSYIPAPYSIYCGINKLMPGTFCQISIKHKKILKTEKFWDLEKVAFDGLASPFRCSENEILEQMETILMNSVSKRMISDVPLGAFLSGGIDSSVIVSLMQACTNQPVRTFSIGFEEKSYDESNHAQQVAAYLGTDHTELFVTPKQAMDVICDLPDIFDEPFADSSQIPTFLVSKMTKKYVTVALSGDGGDEMFAGYNRHFWGRYLWERLEPLPICLRRSFKTVLKITSPKTLNMCFGLLGNLLPGRTLSGQTGDKLAKFLQAADAIDREDFYCQLTSLCNDPLSYVFAATEPETFLNTCTSWPDISDFTLLMQYLDMKTYLNDDIMTKVDRASMGASLEARAPFLDKDVVAFSWRIPVSMKIRRSEGKVILKKFLNRYIPKEIFDRPKMGFGMPIDIWLRGYLYDWAQDLLSSSKLKSKNFFRVKPVRKMLEMHLAGKYNFQHQLWNILMFQAWIEKHG